MERHSSLVDELQGRDAVTGASDAPGAATAAPASAHFEEVYLQYSLLLRKIAIRRFHIPPGEAETLVHDVFATYFMHATEVRAVERYLVGAICNASRYYLRRNDAAEALFCGEHPCAATPSAGLVDEIERKLVLAKILRGIGRSCRDLLHRYYIIGESVRAIAEAVRSTAGSIHVLLHRCRKRVLANYHALSERS